MSLGQVEAEAGQSLVGRARKALSAARQTPAPATTVPSPSEPPESDEERGPLTLTRAQLDRPLENARFRDILARIGPEWTLEKLKSELFKSDPAAASHSTYTLTHGKGDGWESIDLSSTRKLLHGEVCTTASAYRTAEGGSKSNCYSRYLSQEAPELSHLPAAMRKVWSEKMSDEPAALLKGVLERHPMLSTTVDHCIYIGYGERSYANLYCQSKNPNADFNIRLEDDETYIGTKLGAGGAVDTPEIIAAAWSRWGLEPHEVTRRMLSETGVEAKNFNAGFTEKQGHTNLNLGLDLSAPGAGVEDAGNLVLTFKENSEGTNIQRSVYHNLVRFSHELQGHGTAKAILRNNFRLYDELKVDSVDLTAAITVGGYAWARYGWQLVDKPEEHQSINKQLQPRLDSLELKPSVRQSVQKLVDSHNPKKLWAISDLKQAVIKDVKETTLGKALLLGVNWHGRLDMHDADSRKRLEHYLG